MNRNNMVTAAVGFIIMAATLALFFILVPEPLPVQKWGLVFMQFAEAVVIIGFIWLPNRSQSAYRPIQLGGFYAVLMGYGILALGSAFLHIFLQSETLKWLLAGQTLLFAVLAVLLLLLSHGAGYIGQEVRQTQQAAAAMQNITAKAAGMYENTANAAYAGVLHKLYEALRFSDHSLYTDTDRTVALELDALETLLLNEQGNLTEDAVSAKVDMILNLINNRQHMVQQLKRGKI